MLYRDYKIRTSGQKVENGFATSTLANFLPPTYTSLLYNLFHKSVH